ncbi:hybrid sensor histidine kinase/response regulator [Sphingomonas sp. LaA6.9]|uniref:hybrid sensor histidine kinase/response regulator n=1 Tax=Sphingomonas sp. LaA6.9 TaxID=2919914 RepID=UPI001F5011D6|nr:hybrid sensor histidine kinase/response regulator [Sphingomonas sp. LaA6.9]MCJ8158207.1 PAS domain S-box protein [Sphingomonas sp. LaA6.9]
MADDASTPLPGSARTPSQTDRMSASELRMLADNMGQLAWLNSASGARYWFNRRWHEYTGKSYGEVKGWGWLQVHHPDHVGRVESGLRKCLASGEPWEDTFPLRAADGSYRWFLARAFPVRDEQGVIRRWFGTDTDVHRQIEAEQALRCAVENAEIEAAERAAMLAQLDEGVIVTDPEGRITFVNEAARRLHGVHRLDIGPEDYSNTYNLFTESGLPHPHEELPLARAVMKGEVVADARWRIRRPDGQEVLAIGSARPFHGADGKVLGAVLTLRDDTARHAAETALRELNTTLEDRVAETIREREVLGDALRQAQKMEAVGQLTGGIAHDFNNLLTIITGNLDMLRRALGDSAEARVRRMVDNALTGAERAAALTQRLLAFSRRQPLSPKPVDIDTLIGGMSDLLARSLGELIEMKAVRNKGLWRVEIDANQLENAILNLAVNARDAMTGGGTLTIETANVTLDEVYAARQAEVVPGDYVVIAVTDTGAGIAQDTLERVFEPFFTTKDVDKGTGLGLSMVYGFVKQSGGHVRIYSELGQGTTVRIYLPRMTWASEEEAQMVEAVPRARIGASETLLVVEDDAGVRAYSVELMRELGYNVIEAHDGPSALRLIEHHEGPIDLLFTDVVMPGMSGRDLVEAARKLRPGLPALYTTGYARSAIVHGGRLDPGVDIITKPFTYDGLAKRLREVLDREG